MNRLPLSAFFDAMVDAYRHADFEAVADCFQLPGAIYFGDDVIILNSRGRLLGLMREHCARNFNMGVRHLKVNVVAQSLSRSNNYSVWATWEHFSGNGTWLYSVPVRYICRDDAAGTPEILLVDLLDLPQCFTEVEVLQMTESRQRRG